jgi:hypothetical protein
MKHNLIDCRITPHAVRTGLTNVLLILMLATVSLCALSFDVSAAPATNLALGMPAVTSSVEDASTLASYAVDGNTSSRWSSNFSDPQWIYVNLGAPYTIGRVVLNWETAYGKSYQIQVSSDAKTWVTVFSVSNGNGGIDDISLAPVTARYVRVLGLQRGTQWGYSLWEIGVYAAGSGSTTSGATSGGSTTGGSTTGSGSSGTSTNHPPVITGTPAASVMAGSGYNFQPGATDADGDTLSFSISNKPAWASFSLVTGRLSGTPGTGNVGTYGNIVISATDGKASASLPAFSIKVNAGAAQTGSLTLSWKAPVKRADGTPLTLSDIDGYRIHYGKTAGNYTSHVNLADGTAQQVNLTDLPLGTYYVVMTTYDVNGLESSYSATVVKNVQ